MEKIIRREAVMAVRDDLTGRKFGRLTVLGYDHTQKTPSDQPKAYWKCKCDCGNTVTVCAQSLKGLRTTSCGCNSSRNNIGVMRRIHGESKTRLYAIWCGMISRCSNPNRIAYKDYGGRGISVCEKWNSYIPFKQWAIENGYTDEFTLERKDVNGGYCPENCEWISKSAQFDNRRNSLLFTYGGKTQNLKKWSEESGIKYGTLRARIFVFGWDFERAISTPVERNVNSA